MKNQTLASNEAARAGRPTVKPGTYSISHARHNGFHFKVESDGSIHLFSGQRFHHAGQWLPEGRHVEMLERHYTDSTPTAIDGYNWCENWSSVEKCVAIWLCLVLRPGAYWSQEGYEVEFTPEVSR
jgi:hypothetical protein